MLYIPFSPVELVKKLTSLAKIWARLVSSIGLIYRKLYFMPRPLSWASSILKGCSHLAPRTDGLHDKTQACSGVLVLAVFTHLKATSIC